MLELIQIARAADVAAAPSAGAAATLGLNVKFFIAQLINFGILLLIFWKWILPNVAKTMRQRSERIQKSLNDATRIEKEKQEFEVWKNLQMSEARKEASAIVASAQTDATKAKDEILKTAKQEQEKIVNEAKTQIEQEKNLQLQAAKSELADLVTNATEKILRHKLDDKKDTELVKEMLKSI